MLLDTGVIVALLDCSEQFHETCVECLQDLAAPLVTCEAVIAESCYLLRNVRGAVDAILENVETGIFQIPSHLSQSAARVRHILRKYKDREVDLADVCLVYLAEQLGVGDILTLDRDFEFYRWGANKRFHFLIPLR